VNFRGERRSNETHFSATDSEARLARKGNGREAKLSLAGHVLIENRNGLVVDVEVNSPSGNAEREAALKCSAATEGGSGASPSATTRATTPATSWPAVGS
jgi:hypothetical protein